MASDVKWVWVYDRSARVWRATNRNCRLSVWAAADTSCARRWATLVEFTTPYTDYWMLVGHWPRERSRMEAQRAAESHVIELFPRD